MVVDERYLGVGVIGVEMAHGTRKCVCGRLMKKGEKHFVVLMPKSRFKTKINFCRTCGYELVALERQRLFKLEIAVFGRGG